MAKISMSKSLIPAAVGFIDIGAKQLNAAVAPIAGFSVSEMVEAGLTLGSAILNYMGKDLEKTELIFNSSLPLFEQMVVNKIMALIPPTPATVVRPGITPQVTAPRITGASPQYPVRSKYGVTG